MNLKWNQEYIIANTLSDEVFNEIGDDFRKLAEDEIFVEHPIYFDYYFSQYGRCISTKRNKPHMLGACIGGQPDRQYMYYTIYSKWQITIGMHRAVADIFCPNFWNRFKNIEAHHVDGNRLNNNANNLVLLTTELHAALHKIKKIVLFDEGKITEYKNPLDLVYDTNMELMLEDILLANKGKKKPLKSDSKYTVFNVKGYKLGFQYYPKKQKKK